MQMMPKLLRTGLLAVLILSLNPGFSAEAATRKSSSKRTSASRSSGKKKATSRKKTRRRSVSRRAPKVSPTIRLAANEDVQEMLERASDIPLENAAALVPFYEMLYQSQKGASDQPLRILHYGDSHTAADEWTGTLRTLLQGQFGDGGSGYSFAGYPFRGYRRLDLRSGATRRWKSQGLLSKDGDGMWGLGGVSVSTSYPNESIYLTAECSRLELFYLQQPGGGELQLYDNDEAIERISTEGETGPGYYHYQGTPGPHRFELKTLNRKPVRLFGWVTEKDRGITYESLGINGAQASVIFHWDEEMLASNIARRNPALIVLAYGTNEASNGLWTRDSYAEMFSSLLQRLRAAAPTASILVLGPPDHYFRTRRSGWMRASQVDEIVAAQRQSALANNCAFWDMREKMGGAGAMKEWVTAGLAQGDYVHFTNPGYHRLGYALFRDLMYNYERYTQVREAIIGQSSDGQTVENH